MAQVHPYLTFDGNCEAAFTFYKSIFGGEFPYIGKYAEMPPTEGFEIPESEAQKIMHVSLKLGAGTMLMGCDSSSAFGQQPVQGSNFSVYITAETKEEADRIFNGLSAGGTVTMPLADTFWGSYFGMFTDKFGILWMIGYDECEQ
ncbi:VOC family protein [Flavobacterium soli]|uniref:VOC family protein n=1 Tax=Flavobacterium soli TaxID=344881 RepID=UPI0003F74965|nr:VOC family protein [Flavobacterium soli]